MTAGIYVRTWCLFVTLLKSSPSHSKTLNDDGLRTHHALWSCVGGVEVGFQENLIPVLHDTQVHGCKTLISLQWYLRPRVSGSLVFVKEESQK